QAFLGCDSLDEIKIPNSVTQIAYGVFQRCSSLLKVDMTELDHVPVLGGEIIDRDTNPNLKFIVADQNMKTAFQNANIWSNYSSKIVTQAEFNSI
ncbi:MAG: leucine-rich repeat protein, partial [Ruminococcus sp.]|nr:leucine-rich repeat protein [Ruminococcus sp.]